MKLIIDNASANGSQMVSQILSSIYGLLTSDSYQLYDNFDLCLLLFYIFGSIDEFEIQPK